MTPTTHDRWRNFLTSLMTAHTEGERLVDDLDDKEHQDARGAVLVNLGKLELLRGRLERAKKVCQREDAMREREGEIRKRRV